MNDRNKGVFLKTDNENDMSVIRRSVILSTRDWQRTEKLNRWG